jgi:hypothetical protein
MTLHPHLPPAVDFPDADSLRDVGDDEPASMLVECRRSCRNLQHFRDLLVTPVALTLWKVLIRGEELLVASSGRRIETEIASRYRNSAGDAS